MTVLANAIVALAHVVTASAVGVRSLSQGDAALGESHESEVSALPSCSLEGYTFATFCQEHTTCGNATGQIVGSTTSPGCDRAEMVSTGDAAASAAFASEAEAQSDAAEAEAQPAAAHSTQDAHATNQTWCPESCTQQKEANCQAEAVRQYYSCSLALLSSVSRFQVHVLANATLMQDR